ncbi:MAG: PEGA domain-containing protein [Sandaracinaceae bacterium]|nr:PEGA domain-containing protein [Sandaracinaceae bacterium]
MRARIARSAFAAALGALVLSAAPGRAQLPDPPERTSETDSARARDAFVHGMELARESRFADALEEFLRSYELSGSPVALFNVASTLRSLGRVSEAQEAFDRLLAMEDLDDAMRRAASEHRADVAARVARVQIEGVPAGSARVAADGRERGSFTSRPIELALDPGEHALELRLDGHLPWRWRGPLDEGSQVSLSARLAPITGSILEEPALWIVVVASAVAGLVIASVAIDQSLQLGARTSPVVVLP